METANLITVVVGIIALLIGIAAFLNPNIARWIRSPGSPRLKAIIAILAGIILIIVALIIEFPTN
jgi:threonine/homoserine/homoserine lactone efflux protein